MLLRPLTLPERRELSAVSRMQVRGTVPGTPGDLENAVSCIPSLVDKDA